MQTTIRDLIQLAEASTRPAKLETVPLPVAAQDLDPVLSAEAVEYHYEHLARGYAQRYNSGEGDADFNRAGSFLHNQFFSQLRGPRPNNRPRGAVLALIEQNFKTWEDFKEQFAEAALSIQGSGWVYLSTGGEIKTIRNHAVRTDICVLLDMWEHAYALDYQWRRDQWVNNFWKIVDWNVCEQRL